MWAYFGQVNQIVQSQLVSVLLFKVKIFLWLSLLLSSLAVAHCQEGCKQHPKKIVFECCWIFLSNKMSAEGSKLSTNSLIFLGKTTVQCVICFLKKKLQVHKGWKNFLKDHPYFHATTFLLMANVFFAFWLYFVIV